jgi:2-hydroxyglutarate dehydrogenase
MRATFDAAVVGGGIVGLATAFALTERGRSVAVLEAEDHVAAHQTGHNSGVIHSGLYYKPNSLKARFCRAGREELYRFCAAEQVPCARVGKLVVATHDAELPALAELERRGRANGLALRHLSAAELREIEPHAAGLVALHSPATGVVDFGQVAMSYARDLEARGGIVATGCAVSALRPAETAIVVEHAHGSTAARVAVGCAGAWSDRLAIASGAPQEPRIVPFRGAYLRLRPERRDLVRANIYPVPDPDLPFLGMHLTRRIDGEVLLGPSALMVGARDAYRATRIVARDLRQSIGWPGTWRLAARFWRTGIAEMSAAASRRAFVRALRRFVPELRAADVLAGPAGIRAQALGRDGALIDDFVVHRTERAVHVRNAPSPAATSSLALARLIADEADAFL